MFRHAVTSKLTISYHATVIELRKHFLHYRARFKPHNAAEQVMKIYLLMLLIGTLLTAIHFTSAPEQRSKTLP
jgi:hypothetical protein